MAIKTPLPPWVAGIVTVILTAAPLLAQQRSRCADCHLSVIDSPAPDHLMDWETSAHRRNDVGCESCHGGDPTTFEPFLAHQEILNSGNPASPANRKNIPRTCGTCHVGQFVYFQNSTHYQLLQQGNQRTPVCTTCHEEVAARLLSPKALEARCASCHGEGKVSPRPDYPVQGREFLTGIREIRTLLRQTRPMIQRIKNNTRRERLQEAYQQAEVPLREAVEGGHQFVFDQLEERLARARQRTSALLEELANPSQR